MIQIWGGCARKRVTALVLSCSPFGRPPRRPNSGLVRARRPPRTCSSGTRWRISTSGISSCRGWTRRGTTSPEEYLEAVRYKALDSTFSYIADRASTEAPLSSSQSGGFGFATSFGPADDLRISEVYPGSPAADGGLERGDQIVEINGRSVADWLRTGEFGNAYGPREVGVRGELVVVRAGAQLRVSMVKRTVVIPTVSHTTVFDIGGRRVGYVFFRNFVEPSFEALAGAFATLSAAGANEVGPDLRYNGGGMLDVAQYFGSLLGGSRTAGQVFAVDSHNDRNAFRNETLRFETQPGALTLDRLVVITTQSSASASELVINALRPFIPVVIVGPDLRQARRSVRDPVLRQDPGARLVSAPERERRRGFLRRSRRQLHRAGRSGPSDRRPDGRIAARGFTVISTGGCSAPTAAAADRSRAQRATQAPRPIGWDSVLNAQ